MTLPTSLNSSTAIQGHTTTQGVDTTSTLINGFTVDSSNRSATKEIEYPTPEGNKTYLLTIKYPASLKNESEITNYLNKFDTNATTKMAGLVHVLNKKGNQNAIYAFKLSSEGENVEFSKTYNNQIAKTDPNSTVPTTRDLKHYLNKSSELTKQIKEAQDGGRPEEEIEKLTIKKTRLDEKIKTIVKLNTLVLTLFKSANAAQKTDTDVDELSEEELDEESIGDEDGDNFEIEREEANTFTPETLKTYLNGKEPSTVKISELKIALGSNAKSPGHLELLKNLALQRVDQGINVLAEIEEYGFSPNPEITKDILLAQISKGTLIDNYIGLNKLIDPRVPEQNKILIDIVKELMLNKDMDLRDKKVFIVNSGVILNNELGKEKANVDKNVIEPNNDLESLSQILNCDITNYTSAKFGKPYTNIIYGKASTLIEKISTNGQPKETIDIQLKELANNRLDVGYDVAAEIDEYNFSNRENIQLLSVQIDKGISLHLNSVFNGIKNLDETPEDSKLIKNLTIKLLEKDARSDVLSAKEFNEAIIFSQIEMNDFDLSENYHINLLLPVAFKDVGEKLQLFDLKFLPMLIRSATPDTEREVQEQMINLLQSVIENAPIKPPEKYINDFIKGAGLKMDDERLSGMLKANGYEQKTLLKLFQNSINAFFGPKSNKPDKKELHAKREQFNAYLESKKIQNIAAVSISPLKLALELGDNNNPVNIQILKEIALAKVEAGVNVMAEIEQYGFTDVNIVSEILLKQAEKGSAFFNDDDIKKISDLFTNQIDQTKIKTAILEAYIISHQPRELEDNINAFLKRLGLDQGDKELNIMLKKHSYDTYETKMKKLEEIVLGEAKARAINEKIVDVDKTLALAERLIQNASASDVRRVQLAILEAAIPNSSNLMTDADKRNKMRELIRRMDLNINDADIIRIISEKNILAL